jgi:hypothetical protein
MDYNIIFIYKQNRHMFQTQVDRVFNSLYFIFFSFFGEYHINLPGIFLSNNKFVVDLNTIKVFKTLVYKMLHILCFCWSSSFDLIGYNFNLQKKLKKNIIRFALGFSKHKIITAFRDNIRIFGHKRYFTLFSSSIENYYIVINFLLNLRNIFPYKKRGLVPAIIPSIWLKPGKKTKFK